MSFIKKICIAIRHCASKFISPIQDAVKNKKRSDLRKIMRGYRRLKEGGNLDKISKIQRKLSISSLALKNEDFSPLIMGSGCKNFELVTRQYLVLLHGYTSLRCRLLLAEDTKNKRISYALPKLWREILESEGYLVNNFSSSILWSGYVLARFFYGVLKIFEIILKGSFSKERKDEDEVKYCYFIDLKASNLESNHSCGLLSWYYNWVGNDSYITSIRHAIKTCTFRSFKGKTVDYQSSPIPNPTSYLSSFKYMIWGISAIIITLIDLFRGRWWHALLLNQAALSGLVRNISKSRLAKQYMFNNSSWIYRPIWTYDAELKGCDIVFYFYSTNCEPYQTSNYFKPLYLGYELMSWSRYLVWDKYQEDFIRRAVGNNGSIEIVGPIDFSGKICRISSSKSLSIAVFDVTPFRSSRYCMLADDDRFHIPLFVNQFLEHVSRKLAEHSYRMLWKRKRDVGKQSHPSYRRMQELISQRDNVFEVQPDTSARSLIANSYAVISSPYTSTAVIAKEMGKPSVYYDPSKLLQKGDPASHGIMVIQSELELDEWLNSLS